jgi:hypothetical protein
VACLCHSFSKTVRLWVLRLIYDAIRDNILERWWSGQMFEIGILCVIAIAIGYCAPLWIMGRRGDVIYGQFIQTEQFPAVEPPPAPMRLDVESMMREIRDATYG